MRRLCLLILLGLTACSAGGTASASPAGQFPSATATTTPEPSASPTVADGASPALPSPQPIHSPSPVAAIHPAFAVLVDLFTGGLSYNISLVGVDGKVVARAAAAKRTGIADSIELPYVSASRSRLYFLDGDRDVRYLKADGTTGLVTSVPGTAHVHAAFAINPDDTRIAVALLDYSVSPVALTLYVEDIGGGHHAVIFTSFNHYIWPVAWHQGQLVVSYLGPNAVPFKSNTTLYSGRDLTNYPYGPNPYGGINFHVINPVTALRTAIISGGGASGLLSQAGTAVVQGAADDWAGNWINWNSPHDYGNFSAAGSLSPNGQMIAACCPQPGGSGQVVIWYRNDQSRVLPVAGTSGDWVGWLDDGHLVTGFYQSYDGLPSVVDLSSNVVISVSAHGIVAAIFPSNLEP